MEQLNWQQIEEEIRRTLINDGAHAMLIDTFVSNARRVYEGVSGMISRDDIAPVDTIPDYDSLTKEDAQTGRHALDKVVMIKLNGGLGTSMGLEKAKSLLPVKDGLTFLDIIVRQVLHLRKEFGAPLPLLFMTSYNTDSDTLEKLADYPELSSGQNGIPLTFLQNRVPKLLEDTLTPAQFPAEPDKAWCPPGHGDLYTALMASGLLEILVTKGYQYAFVSNADNLGAVIDPAIPGMMANRKTPFLMEVTDRTEADKKGGHLARDVKNGQLLLRESAQCPADEKDEFQDIVRYRYFNTNNLWIDLTALKRLVDETKAIPAMPVMVNRKPLDPRDETTPTVLQLETAMGSAINSFTGAEALRVPRTRFAPVKTTDDLLALWSDAYQLTDAMHIRLSDSRTIPGPPVIHLDPKFFKKIDDFKQRFPNGVPSLINCRSLTVKGDHIFDAGVKFDGDMTLESDPDQSGSA